MEQLFTTIIGALSPSALPLVVVIVAGIYFFYKFKSLEQDRMTTKQQRDSDSQNLHDIVQKNTWEINNLKLENQHRDTILDDLRQQCNELNVNLAVVSQKLDTLVDAIKDLKGK